MSFKPAKSRSLVVKRGKESDMFSFSLGGRTKSKSLGKMFRGPAVPMTTVEGFERKTSHFLHRWLGLPRSLSSIALYGHKNKLRLPFSSLTEEFTLLSFCLMALGEGLYHWRHDQVLRAIADVICTGICRSKHRPAKQAITFVKAGENPQPQPSPPGGLLVTARDWQLKVDLGRQLKFPDTIAVTTLRPDAVLMSETTRQAVLLELTVPWEDQTEEAYERRRAKYEGLVGERRSRGWRARCLPIEVGSSGFARRSLCRALKLLGITGLHSRKAIKTTIEAAEKASRWLWIKRGDPWTTQATWTQAGAWSPLYLRF
uniref:uncharacterized protein n=1 Tax=Centroberyx gerrardi TaxID=166262 RepID=UPI003AAED46F